jgi:hypothetical protein
MMTTHQQNQQAIQEGQQGGPAQKNQAAQDGMGAGRDLNTPGVQEGDKNLPPPQQQTGLNPKQVPEDGKKESGDTSPAGGNYNPGGMAGKEAGQEKAISHPLILASVIDIPESRRPALARPRRLAEMRAFPKGDGLLGSPKSKQSRRRQL